MSAYLGLLVISFNVKKVGDESAKEDSRLKSLLSNLVFMRLLAEGSALLLGNKLPKNWQHALFEGVKRYPRIPGRLKPLQDHILRP